MKMAILSMTRGMIAAAMLSVAASDRMPTLDDICANHFSTINQEVVAQKSIGIACVHYYGNSYHEQMLIYVPEPGRIRVGTLIAIGSFSEGMLIERHKVFNRTTSSNPGEFIYEYMQDMPLTDEESQRLKNLFLKYRRLLSSDLQET